jgi:hypothetical protein
MQLRTMLDGVLLLLLLAVAHQQVLGQLGWQPLEHRRHIQQQLQQQHMLIWQGSKSTQLQQQQQPCTAAVLW